MNTHAGPGHRSSATSTGAPLKNVLRKTVLGLTLAAGISATPASAPTCLSPSPAACVPALPHSPVLYVETNVNNTASAVVGGSSQCNGGGTCCKTHLTDPSCPGSPAYCASYPNDPACVPAVQH